MAGQSPASLPHVGLILDGTAPAVDASPAPLPHLGMLGGLGRPVDISEYGTFSITGQDASLLRQRKVIADVGYIAIYGQVGLLSKSANSSGESAPLPHLASLFAPTYTNRTLTADPGAYNYAGSDALIDHEHDCDQGTYSVAGQDAGLLLGSRLFADQGSYSIAGQDAESMRGGPAQVMPADFGDYQITGQDASIAAGRYTGAEHGFFALLGQIAGLSVGVSGDTPFPADFGEFLVEGFDAGLNIGLSRSVGVAGPAVARYFVIINGKRHFGTKDEIESLIQSLAIAEANKKQKKRLKIAVKEGEEKKPAIQIEMKKAYDEAYKKREIELEEEELLGVL